jgi:hypothetical protein
MVKWVLFCFALVFAGMVGAPFGLGASNASAADDCITESNLVPPKGSRWYYHDDRATNRKCWHIGPLATLPGAPHTQRMSVRSELGQTGPSARVLGKSKQAALFNEFLRWKEHQSTLTNRAVEPSPHAVSQ